MVPLNGIHLTDRELQVALLVACGQQDKEIAADLIISASTAKKHVSQILLKTRSQNRTEFTAWVWSNGLLRMAALRIPSPIDR